MRGTGVGNVVALLVGTAVLVVALGLVSSLVPLELRRLGATDTGIGLAGAAYFLGLLTGGFQVVRLLRRVGHVRTYAALVSVLALATLLPSALPWRASWAVGRLGMGLAMGGIYVIIESWLTTATPPAARGRVLGVYQFLVLAGFALGQALLAVPDPHGSTRLVVAASLVCVATLPVALSTEPVPDIVVPPRGTVWRVGVVAPLALAGAAQAGLFAGAMLGMGPAVAAAVGVDTAGVAWGVGTFMLAGALVQGPVGLASDRLDRRQVLAWLAGIASAMTAALAVVSGGAAGLVVVAVLGAAALSLYPVVVAYAFDRVETGDEVDANTALFAAYCVGSIAGSTGSAALFSALGPVGFALLPAVTGFAFAGAAILTVAQRVPVPHGDKVRALPARATSPTAPLDPRVDGSGEGGG